MDRLKKDWQETQIPEEVCLRARNAAWAKIQRPAPVRSRLIWATAASALLVATAAVWIWSVRGSRLDRVSAPARPEVSAPAKATTQIAEVREENPEAPQMERMHERSVQTGTSRSGRHIKRPAAPVSEPERVVLNMTLPETGARMIWIMDSNFHF
jgi:hypothetical protein